MDAQMIRSAAEKLLRTEGSVEAAAAKAMQFSRDNGYAPEFAQFWKMVRDEIRRQKES